METLNTDDDEVKSAISEKSKSKFSSVQQPERVCNSGMHRNCKLWECGSDIIADFRVCGVGVKRYCRPEDRAALYIYV
jgi:hypothetical protein